MHKLCICTWIWCLESILISNAPYYEYASISKSRIWNTRGSKSSDKGYLILNYILLRVVLIPWTLANRFLFIRLPKAWNLRWNLVLFSILPYVYLLNPAIPSLKFIRSSLFVLILPNGNNQNVSWNQLRTSRSVTLSLGATYCPGSMSPQGIISWSPQEFLDYCAGHL